ncbi:putative v-snare microsporum canis [Erysiphe necator]|uniref:Putative v-snare microsporum canis n=1 Tax=Uncinula necator TaxID=52586 RepID=A0A0B1P2D4_UNCNE|nr:putative v-snare microsporum canis [Erysiphe necator]
MLSSTCRKRKAESPKSIYSNKSRNRPVIEGRVDPLHGQRSALPGLDGEFGLIGSDGELGEENKIDSKNALAYLTAVREEAIGIPTVLFAPKTSSKNDDQSLLDDLGDSTSRYEDGAYLSISSPVLETEREESSLEPSLFIISRYERLHADLHRTPPAGLVSKLKPYQRTHVGPLDKDLSRWWIGHLRNANPNPAQVASMDKITVLRLLGLLTQGSVLKTGLKSSSCLSLWIWSLLARLPDRGDLSSEEIAVVRGLGKKAISLGICIKEDPDWGVCLIEDETSNDSDIEESYSSDFLDFDELHQEKIIDDKTEIDRTKLSSSPSALDTQIELQTENINISQEQGEEHESLKGIIPVQGSIDNAKQDSSKDNSVDRALKNTGSDSASNDFLTAKARVLEHYCNVADQESANLKAGITLNTVSDDKCYSSALRWNAQATVDMILTIVGESYGQLDLLASRSPWTGVV